MQLAINEDRRGAEAERGLEMKAEAGSAQHRSDDWARRLSPVTVSYKPGKYPSKLDWSLPGHVLGFIYCTETRMDQAMLALSSNGKRGAG